MGYTEILQAAEELSAERYAGNGQEAVHRAMIRHATEAATIAETEGVNAARENIIGKLGAFTAQREQDEGITERCALENVRDALGRLDVGQVKAA